MYMNVVLKIRLQVKTDSGSEWCSIIVLLKHSDDNTKSNSDDFTTCTCSQRITKL